MHWTTLLRRKPAAEWILLTASLFAGGCGLAEYEERMSREQQALKRYDEENSLLDRAVNLSVKKNKEKKDKEVIEVFFRPPRGVSKDAAAEQWGSQTCYVFSRTESAQNVGAAKVAKAPLNAFQKVYLGVAGDDGKAFEDEVLKAFSVPAEGSKGEQLERTPPGRDFMTFKMYRADMANATLLLYIYMRKSTPVAAVGFQVDSGKENDDATVKAIGFSLDSLALGGDARRQKKLYAECHRE